MGAPAVEVKVEGHKVVGEKRPYAVYKLLVSEGDQEWRLERRWNDLRLAINELNRECADNLRASADKIPKFNVHGFRSSKAMLEPTFLDTRATAMESLLKAYLAALPTSFLQEEGPAALRFLLGQTASPVAGAYRTPSATPSTTPRSTMSWLKAPTSVYGAIHEEVSSKLKAAGHDEHARDACKKVLFDSETEKQEANEDTPAKKAAKKAWASPTSTFLAIWVSVVILPIAAVVAKELVRLPM